MWDGLMTKAIIIVLLNDVSFPGQPTQKGMRCRVKVTAMGNGTLCRTETSESEPCLGNETLVRTENANRPNVRNGVIGVARPSLLFQT